MIVATGADWFAFGIPVTHAPLAWKQEGESEEQLSAMIQAHCKTISLALKSRPAPRRPVSVQADPDARVTAYEFSGSGDLCDNDTTMHDVHFANL